MRNSSVPWLGFGGMLVIELLTALVLYIVTADACGTPDNDDINITLNISNFLSTLLILFSAFPLIHLTEMQNKVDGADPLCGTSLSVWDVILHKLEAIFLTDGALALCMLPLWLFAILRYHSWNWVNSFHCMLGILTIQTCMLALSFYRSKYINITYNWLIVIPGILPLVIIPACTSFGVRAVYDMQAIYVAICLSIIALALCQAYAFLQHTQRDRDTPMRLCILLLTPIWLLITYVYFVMPKGAYSALHYDAFGYVWALPISFALIFYMIWCSFSDLLPTRRIRNELPKTALSRALRLPFVSGAINGIIFSALLMLIIDAVILCISASITALPENIVCDPTQPPLGCILPNPLIHNIPKFFVTMLFGWLQYALLYSGVILFIRQRYKKRFAFFALCGIAILLVIMPVPLALLLEMNELCYFSPFYLNFIIDNADIELTSWEIELRILPLLVIGLALLFKPCKRYFAALNQDA